MLARSMVVIGSVLGWAGAGPSAAQTDVVKLRPADGASQDEFGRTVAISRDYLLSGAHFDDDAGAQSGSGYVFRREGADWIQQIKLTASDSAAGDRFGEAVAIYGERAAVGASFATVNGIRCGCAYVFRREGGGWTREARLWPSNGGANDEFGASVSIGDGYVLVGGHRHSGPYPECGAAYVFRLEGSTWAQEAVLTAPDAAAYDDFGVSVSISGSWALVGADQLDPSGPRTGGVYVFKRDAGAWNLQAKLTASDPTYADFFGWSVSIDGHDAWVGAPFQDTTVADAGAAYAYHFDGASWVQTARLTASDAAWQDLFGWSVSLHGDYAVAGAFAKNGVGTRSGAAYVFRHSAAGWTQIAKLTAPDAAAGDQFGQSVGLSVPYAVIGSPLDDASGLRSGSAYVYSIVPCTPIGIDTDQDCDVDDADVAAFRTCYSGPNVPYTGSDCGRFDLDDDGAVDQSDFGLLQLCISGRGGDYPPGC